MSLFGDGREERMDALMLELRLRNNPGVTERRLQYNARVETAWQHAKHIGRAACIEELIAHCPAYIRGLLEASEDADLFERYARTFQKRWRPTRGNQQEQP